MDPSIMKLLEEDEDESMHSGADVEAFQAALNRDIGGDVSTPQLADSDLILASIHQPQQNNARKTSDGDPAAHVSDLQNEGSQEFNSSIDLQKHSIENSCQTSGIEAHEMEVSSVSGLDKTVSSPTDSHLQKVPQKAELSGTTKNNNKQIPFVLLLPALKPHLDKNSEIQLQNLFTKLRKNEIAKTEFVKLMRNIVGDKVLRLALSQLQVQQGSNQSYVQPPMIIGRPPIRPPVSSNAVTEPTQAVQVQSALPGSDSSEPGKQFSQTPTSAFPKKDDPSKPLQYPQNSFSIYGNNSGNYQIYPGTSVSTAVPSIKPIPHQTTILPKSAVMNPVRQSSLNNPNAIHGSLSSYNSGKSLVHPNSTSYAAPLPPVTYVKEEAIEQATQVHNSQSYSSELGHIQLTMVKDEHSDRPSSKVSFSTVAHVGPSNSGRTPPKKPAVAQKKPLDSLGSPPQSNKKQKVSGGYHDQSIEQLNDVTAVSGVNLSEEEEQLLSAPKEDSRVSEASRKVVQEEEERLILERVPLRKKLADIMMKFGLKSTGADVEKCLSLCVEERLHGLLCNLIRLSKQRIDVEKTKHRTFITSDVRQQLLLMNSKAKEEWEKKQAEAEKLRKVNENDNDNKTDGDKDDGRQKPKANKEEDDKMRTNAANVAARAAVGVDDMLSKWQLIAQARQKHEVSSDKEVNRKTPKNPKDPNKRSLTGSRKAAKNQPNATQGKVVRAISVRDVISGLERESQMCKSTLIYRLYEKVAQNPSLSPNNN